MDGKKWPAGFYISGGLVVRKILLFSLLWLLASLPALAEKRWFTLVNESGYTIDYMYVRPLDSGEWSEDILGQDNLTSGSQVDVTWTGKRVPRVFDVHIKYEDGETAEIKGLSPPNNVTKLHIYWDKKTIPQWE